MGRDINSHAERRVNNGWIRIGGIQPFMQRNYGVCGFIADVMNLSAVTPVSQPRGVPPDASDEVTAACVVEGLHASALPVKAGE